LARSTAHAHPAGRRSQLSFAADQARRIAFAAVGLLLGVAGCADDPEVNFDLGPSASLGAAYARQRDCNGCHQSIDVLNGTLSGQEIPQHDLGANVFGSNLTPDDANGLGRWSDGQVVRSILDGVDQDGLPLCATNHAYGALGMTGLEARSIVAFLRSLPAVSHHVPQSECPPLKPYQPDLATPPDDDGGAP
jgi:hypothetical protein